MTGWFLRSVILNTKELMPDYYNSTIKQRVYGPTNMGSSYNLTFEEIEESILNADWQETSHPNLLEGCRIFKAKLSGFFGLEKVENLAEEAEIYAVDPKGTGFVSMGVVGIQGELVEDTYLIIGKEKENDEWVMFTFHPGEPVRPSTFEVNKNSSSSGKIITHGTKLTKEEIEELGFKTVKLLYKAP